MFISVTQRQPIKKSLPKVEELNAGIKPRGFIPQSVKRLPLGAGSKSQVRFPAGQGSVLFGIACRPALGPTQLPV
jgi:hypothetical protein